MTNNNTPKPFDVVDAPPRALRGKGAIQARTARVIAAADHPGQWIVASTGDTGSSAGARATYLRKRYGLDAVSRMGTVYVRMPAVS